MGKQVKKLVVAGSDGSQYTIAKVLVTRWYGYKYHYQTYLLAGRFPILRERIRGISRWDRSLTRGIAFWGSAALSIVAGCVGAQMGNFYALLIPAVTLFTLFILPKIVKSGRVCSIGDETVHTMNNPDFGGDFATVVHNVAAKTGHMAGYHLGKQLSKISALINSGKLDEDSEKVSVNAVKAVLSGYDATRGEVSHNKLMKIVEKLETIAAQRDKMLNNGHSDPFAAALARLDENAEILKSINPPEIEN